MTRRTSLSLPPGLPLSEWRHLGRQMYLIADSSAWWLGDWLIYGQTHYPDRYKRAITETSLDYQTLRNYAWIARKFPQSRRRAKLSFQHHAEVAGLPPEEQDTWLTRAELGGWSRNELRSRIRAGRNGELPGKDVSLVRMDVVAERKERWQKAAEAAELELQAWIVATLDSAAMEAIDEGDQP
ncbi:LmbU family transcriptional regulator [Nonomuraea sp. MCN248]|uniref:LmbU family transcriptional regulator n=1 Tax=Nonomuraea corallina TaxID=2989783 RepID=A0ABT4SMK3_9ACTN|nr:LmbU family transcriptional regulator [Nonomuraea corallina]MDA0638483.1 LmbU family transcriptional regulator [Nonomuraea corallina]